MAFCLLRKSQPSLFGTHEELHSRSATTRTNKKTGKVSTVSATMARVHVADHDYSPRGDVGANIDRMSISQRGIKADPDAEKEWGISKGEMDSLVESVAADIPHYIFTTKTRMRRSDIAFSLNGKDAAGNTLVIERDIRRTGMTAHHSGMHADVTRGGLSKPLNRACMNIYKRLGVKKVDIYANCDVGGYQPQPAAPDQEKGMTELRIARHSLRNSSARIVAPVGQRHIQHRNAVLALKTRHNGVTPNHPIKHFSIGSHNSLQTRINHLHSISQQHRMIGATP